MLLGKFQMTANCYGWSNVADMLMLHSKCCINVPIGSKLNTWSGFIWNVPNLLSVDKWRVPLTRAYNVLKMFSLVSRPLTPSASCSHFTSNWGTKSQAGFVTSTHYWWGGVFTAPTSDMAKGGSIVRRVVLPNAKHWFFEHPTRDLSKKQSLVAIKCVQGG